MSRNTILLIAILILASLLRIYGLTQESLWLDEGFTARRANSTVMEIMQDMRVTTQTPLYFVFMKLWGVVFGTSVYSLRFPAAVFGIGAVWAIFLLARKLFTEKIALLSALILALNPFTLHYSQEARSYSLLLLLSTLSTFYFVKLLQDYRSREGWIYLLFAELTCLSHPLGPLLIPAHALSLFCLTKSEFYPEAKRKFRAILGWFVMVFVFYLPQLWLFGRTIGQKVRHEGSTADWIPLPKWNVFSNLFKQYFGFPSLWPMIGLFSVILLFLWIRKDSRARQGMIVLATLVVAFILLPWIISRTISPIFTARYTIPALTSFVIVLSWGFLEMKRPLRVLFMTGFFLLTGVSLFHYYSGADREPWRETAAYLQKNVRAGDVIVIHPYWCAEVVRQYYRDQPGVLFDKSWVVQDIPAALDSAQHVFFVSTFKSADPKRQSELQKRIDQYHSQIRSDEIQPFAKMNPWSISPFEKIRVIVYQKK